MHDAILREIEKERIREEIIISEIARRRALEAEVRRELMMERELALQRSGDGFPFGSSQQMGFDPPMRFAITGTRFEGRLLEERIAMPQEEMRRLNGVRESGGLETQPFQRRAVDLRISEIKPVSEGGKEKVILLAKPDETISGSKRKASTPPGVDASEIVSDEILKKKAKEEWSCALCKVNATCQRGLNEHLQGKRHKSKETALRAQKGQKNYCIGLIPKKATKSIKAVHTTDPGADEGVKFAGESLVSQKKNQSEIVEKVKKHDGHEKEKYNFWCEMCKVGTLSLKTMNIHKKGKKHVRRVEKNNRKGGSHPEKTAVLVNHAKRIAVDEKNVTSEFVDETLDETRVENRETVDVVEPEDQKVVDEMQEDRTAVDELKEDRMTVYEIKEDRTAVDEMKEDRRAVDMAKPEDVVELKDGELVVS
ncbi:hypothetical protein BUALT_Bualt16G0091100 [Buddleja alternifolia]|uniref:U1-type domain-containing protein n=1 Tax=Buddleja alternifolia TaxID=168488 RepID=A0AAV6WAD0_9LAMI|nr:hypothetical protein BUALT_Bualt16G0091100 [Buddleja alternifolia]